MTIRLTKIRLSENTYYKTVSGVEYAWDIPTLIQYCKEKGYASFDLPIKGIDISILP